MDLNKFINQKVTHTRLGDGHIVHITKNNVSVLFVKGEVQFFSFPNTFKNNIIRFIDIDHEEALTKIDEILNKKPEPKVESKPKPESKPEVKPESNPEVKPEPKQEVKPEPEVVVKKEVPKEEVYKKQVPIEVLTEEVDEGFKFPNSVKEDLETVLFDELYQKPITSNQDDYEDFLNEFKDYWEHKKLLVNLVVIYSSNKKIYKKLKEDVIDIVTKTITREPSNKDKGLTTLFLAMVAHKEYDGSIWPYIERELEDVYLHEDQLHVNRAIRKLITDNTFGGEVSILIHAGIFIKYYKDYYSFMYEIYKANFEQNTLNVPLEEILIDTFRGIKDELMKEEGDTLSLKITNGTYYLAKHTKQALIISPEEMAKVFKGFIKHIDLWYHENKYDKTEPELHRALKTWLEGEATKITKIIRNKKAYNDKTTFRLDIDNLDLYLKFKMINLVGINNIDYKKLNIHLIEDKVKTPLNIDVDYRIYQRIGYYTVRIFDRVIKNPLGTAKLIITYENKTAYSSDENLSKDIYFFNVDGEEIITTKNYLGYAYIIHNVKEKFYNAKEHFFKTYKISYLEINEDFILGHDNAELEQKQDLPPGLHGEQVLNVNGRVNKKDYLMYKSISSFVFESSLRAKELTLTINKQTRSLSQIVSEDNKTRELFKFEIDLKKFILISDIYNIEVKDLRNNIIAEVDFIYDRELKLTQKDREEPLVYDFVLSSCFTISKKERLNYDLKTENELKYEFKLNNKIVEYIVPLKMPRFKYKQKDNWQLLDDIEVISDELYVTKDITSIDVYLGKDLITLKEKSSNASYAVFDLSILKTVKVDSNKKPKIIFDFNDEKPRHFNLYVVPTLVSKPMIDFTKDGDLILDFPFKCFVKDKWALEVTDPFKGKKVLNLNSKKITINDTIPFKEYTFTIKDKQNLLYGVKMVEFYEETFFITDAAFLEGKNYRLTSADYINKASKEEAAEIRGMGIHFKRKVNEVIELKMTTFDTRNIIYEIDLYNVIGSNTLRPFNYDDILYCEVISGRSEQFLKLKIEDPNGNPIGIDPKKFKLENKFKKKNIPTLYLYVDVIHDLIK